MPSEPETHLFQVDLRGIIDILANHLYSTPTVFIRELLQNACDAIQMRRIECDPRHGGQITLEVIDGPESTLVCTDDGIGLTEEEVRLFLATVGRSSKRDELFHASDDFIGQFGIGLLSCFTVSEEITLITKSAQDSAAPACKWTARMDGTFQISTLAEDVSPGTRVYLRARAGFGPMFSKPEIEKLACHWGRLLPFDIRLGDSEKTARMTLPSHPLVAKRFDHDKAMAFGKEMFPDETPFFDAIPLHSDIGDISGVAFVLNRPSPQARAQKHRVYLKGMLLADENESILPEWAFFVRAVINARSLRPTAGREDFYDDEALDDARAALGQALKGYLVDLSRSNPSKLTNLIHLHWLSFKALAVEDDDFFRTVIDWLPFETTMGDLTLPAILANWGTEILYSGSGEEYRQIAEVSAAQRLCVINATYIYDRELLERAAVLTDHPVQPLHPGDVMHSFEELTEEERQRAFDFVKRADFHLQPFKCQAEMRKFQPADIPVFYASNEAAHFLRSAERAKEGAGDPMLGSMVDLLSQDAIRQAYACVCFNLNHPQVARLADLNDPSVLEAAVKMLYLQSLFLGKQPLGKREFELLNQGIARFLDWGLAISSNKPS
ncbi:MAG: HSP90 family protein [Verrucomicrobiaceae bacterium]|nr:MAG: HSP90 family protein [Verrucomicrobiaceae bacterium]